MILFKIKRLRKVKTELVVLSILIPLVVILGALLVRWPHLQDSNINKTKDRQSEPMPNISMVPETSPPAEPVKQVFEEVTLIIEKEGNKESWQIEIEQETNVEKVLVSAAAKGYLEVKSTDYGGSMGVFIESLGGIENNNIEKVYWHLYINDVLSPVGASQAEVKAGDRVIWKYEKQHDEN